MSKKVITILEARVSETHWEALRNAYRKVIGEHTPIMPTRSYVIQNTKESTQWQIITEWQDVETLQKMRDLGGVPGGMRAFRKALSEPTLTIFEVKEGLDV